ncbi:MAG: hypothetical protein PHS24_01785, partial [Bacilli bacterium]|nr:hypothetical protein [Bacilli bacterium]
MNNEENNYELPKKIDEVNNNQVPNNENIFNNAMPTQPIIQEKNQENIDNLTVKEEPTFDLNINTQNAFSDQNEFQINNEIQNNPTPLTTLEPTLTPNIPGINEEPFIAQQPQISDNDVFPVPISNILEEKTIVEQPINTTPQSVIVNQSQSDLVTPTPEPVSIPNVPGINEEPVVIQQPQIIDNTIIEQPINTTPNSELTEQSQNNLVTPASEPTVIQEPNEQEVKLEKKIVIEEPVIKEKEKGNAIVGFFALLIILGAILAAFWYFISEGIIKMPDNIKLPDGIKLPFKEANTTTTTKAAQQLVINYGLYKESEPSTCPNKPVSLIINEDKTFLFTSITFDTVNNTCASNEIPGTYILNNDNISLTQNNGETIVINVANEDGKLILSVP